MKAMVAAIAVSLAASAAISAETITVKLDAVLCDSCVREIEKTFTRQPEVLRVNVDLAQKRVRIETKRGQTMSDLKVIQLFKNAGYVAGKVARGR